MRKCTAPDQQCSIDFPSLQHCRNESISCVSTRDFSLQCWHGFLGLDKKKKHMLGTERVSAGHFFSAEQHNGQWNMKTSQLGQKCALNGFSAVAKQQQEHWLASYQGAGAHCSLKKLSGRRSSPSDFERFTHCSSKGTLRLICVHLFSFPLPLPEHSGSTKYINDRESEEAKRFTLPHEYQSRTWKKNTRVLSCNHIDTQANNNAQHQHAATHTEKNLELSKLVIHLFNTVLV